jgi:hypothetical protein
MEESQTSRGEYVRQVLGAYRRTPGTTGKVRPADRLLAAELHQRAVPPLAVEKALVLAVAGRVLRPAEFPPLGTVHSLAYFLPVIEEVLELEVSQDYFRYLRSKLAGFYPSPSKAVASR